MPYRARVNERTLLNLPGFHDAAFVYVYVEDTSERELGAAPDVRRRLQATARANFEPRMTLEIADCNRRIELDVRHRLERGPRQLAAQARHARERAAPLPRGARERVRAVRPASARARSATAGVKPGTGPAPTRRRVTRGCGETRQTHRSQTPAGQPMGVRLPPSALRPTTVRPWRRAHGSGSCRATSRRRPSTRSSTPRTARCSAAAASTARSTARAGRRSSRSAGCSAAARPARRRPPAPAGWRRGT